MYVNELGSNRLQNPTFDPWMKLETAGGGLRGGGGGGGGGVLFYLVFGMASQLRGEKSWTE